MLDFACINLEKRKTSVPLAFMDFRKAFHLVDHTTVINNAIKMNLHPSLVVWLTDFKTPNSQVVRYQGVTSTPQHLTCGILQGTKMAPLCFLILINNALINIPAHWKNVGNSIMRVTIDNTTPNFNYLQDILSELKV